ncbi:MAG: VWA domain-containing protein [Cytophagales bacterium]|nr:MAG: VWA domain-containing protein [Cytophagales bacterium]
MLEWFSIEWFLPAQLKQFTWEQPGYLFGMLLLPLPYILRWLLHFKARQKLEIALIEREAVSIPYAILRHIPSILMLLFISLILVALARPQITDEQVERFTEGIDIVLAMDISESMQIEDFKPNRLEAAKEVALNFVKGRFQDRIGIVVFSGDAYSLAPLTTDYNLLKNYISEINFEMVQNRGTAIGSALGVATNRMRESTAKSKVIILLSDGENTAGSIDPITAAELAHAYNCKIYTIGVGKEGAVPFGTDMFGRTRFVENTMDETTLRKIAEIGEGQYFRAQDNQALQDIFIRIDRYEKVEVKETRFKDTKDFYQVYLMWGLLIFLLFMLLKNTFITNALED